MKTCPFVKIFFVDFVRNPTEHMLLLCQCIDREFGDSCPPTFCGAVTKGFEGSEPLRMFSNL